VQGDAINNLSLQIILHLTATTTNAYQWLQVRRKSDRRSISRDDYESFANAGQPTAAGTTGSSRRVSSSANSTDGGAGGNKEELEFNFDEDLHVPMGGGRQNQFSQG
jgi:hypothetical protein